MIDATVVATINWDIINGVFTNTCQCVSILSVEFQRQIRSYNVGELYLESTQLRTDLNHTGNETAARKYR